MGKRFTDTGKWDKAWFRALPPKLKCAKQFLEDRCDGAGIWDIDLAAIEFFVGEPVALDELVEHLKVQLIGDNKLVLTGFIDFQYGNLSESCKPHIPVIQRLKKLNLWKGFQKGLGTLEEKEKEKDKDKEKDLDQEKEGGVGETKTPRFDFDALYREYPRKDGKSQGVRLCKAGIKTQKDYDDLGFAISRYAQHCADNQTEKRFVKHFDTFMRQWRDWLDPETGTGLKPKSVLDELKERGLA